MGRRSSASLLKSIKETDRRAGVIITDDDKRRISMLARWYSLSPRHIARQELDETHWNADVNPHLTEADAIVFANKVRAIRRRLSTLARVEEQGTHVGPLVSGGRFDYTTSTWYATAYGATAAALPWRLRTSINPQFVHHAWFAADVGLQLERAGYDVLSERELSTGTRADGEDVPMDLSSAFVNPNTGTRTEKKPDLAVIGPEASRFIAVEVENDRDRSLATYTEKLHAYDSNTDVHAVWYMCASRSTANRVGSAASSLFGPNSDFPLRIRIIDRDDDWMGIPNFTDDVKLQTDLRSLR